MVFSLDNYSLCNNLLLLYKGKWKAKVTYPLSNVLCIVFQILLFPRLLLFCAHLFIKLIGYIKKILYLSALMRPI